MRITIKSLKDDLRWERGGDILTIEVDEKEVARFYDGEPEDNTLSRNFSDCRKIPDMLRDAYLLGKEEQGKVTVKVEEMDDFYF